MHHFHTNLPYHQSMLRQKEWWVQNGLMTKSTVLPANALFFWKFCFSLRTSYKELIWCTKDLNAHIGTFCKRWSFIWRCFFPVSILKKILYFYHDGWIHYHHDIFSQNFQVMSNKNKKTVRYGQETIKFRTSSLWEN